MSSEEEDKKFTMPASNAALDGARIKTDSSLKYPYFFWSGYKHHVRGMLAGVGVGALIGAAVGSIALAVFPPLGVLSILAFAGAGALFGAEQVGSIGTASGSRAAGLAENHARTLDPTNGNDPGKIATDKLMYNGKRHHYEYPEDRDKKRFFSWKSGGAGLVVGVTAGALIGKVAAGMAVIAPIAKAIAVIGVAHVAAPIVAGAIVFGLLGISFGIERSIFKSVFNKISNVTEGKNRVASQDLGKQQNLGKENDEELLAHRLHRQKDSYDLRTQYDEQIFMNGVKSYVKGGLGGVLLGGFFGAAAGLLVVGGLFALGATAPLLAIGAAFAVAGALYGIKTFGEAGYNAGTEATARSIDDEFKLSQAQKNGITQVVVRPAPEEPKKGIIATTFGGLLNGISKLSGKSKALYESVYENDATVSPEATALMKNHPLQAPLPYNSGVTPEDAKALEDKLSAGDKRNFANIIAKSQVQQPSVQL